MLSSGSMRRHPQIQRDREGCSLHALQGVHTNTALIPARVVELFRSDGIVISAYSREDGKVRLVES